ncbi:type III-B CRISPR module-associated protein Cmr5 [Thermodesulfovibrio sp. 3462-1]|jgi:CRISPR-associated protein Cmr5|uniref:CRISPR type III-B/RAMP module-associated protein Cmr5 n=1 Tax=Thermodesulfovibrio obliviosus TaxID=3118332 RepID=A0AAU8H6Q6_9BACT
MAEKESFITKLEKGRAEFAYRCVEEAKQTFQGESKKQKEYKSYVKKIPSMVLSNGLGQTLAFVKAKSKKENAYDLIYKQLTEYMKSNHTTRISMQQSEADLVKWVISCNSQDYRYITQEILAFLQWLKRFAEGLIEEEE